MAVPPAVVEALTRTFNSFPVAGSITTKVWPAEITFWTKLIPVPPTANVKVVAVAQDTLV